MGKTLTEIAIENLGAKIKRYAFPRWSVGTSKKMSSEQKSAFPRGSVGTSNALTTSITEGLPREIALRQKQYAYYRDLLLSFPKPEEVAELR